MSLPSLGQIGLWLEKVAKSRFLICVWNTHFAEKYMFVICPTWNDICLVCP